MECLLFYKPLMLFYFLIFVMTASCVVRKSSNGEKRLLLNDAQAVGDRFVELERKLQEITGKISALESKNTQLSEKMNSLESENTNLKSTIGAQTQTISTLTGTKGGAIYIRWGRTDCPSVNGTQIVYSGIAGGGSHVEIGSGTTHLCLPHDPDYAPSNFPIVTFASQVAHVFGAEYQYSYGHVQIDDDVPCSVCMDTNAVTSMMIPGKSSCPSGWRAQYIGHLCANYFGFTSTEYVCVDDSPQYFEGRRQNLDGRLFYPAVTVCGSLPCPPYENAKYLACTVCTK